MRIVKNILFVLLAVCLASCSHISKKNKRSSYWTHLELGAGNYGQDGHTKISQQKTVLKELTYVSKLPNYIDQLPLKDTKPYNPKEQHAILFWTLDKLVSTQGEKGIFFVNDLYGSYAQDAAIHLKNYAKSKNYKHIIIKVVPGDYLKLNASDILKSYGKDKFDSVHLKGIEVSFYNYGMDGDDMLSSEQSRAKARWKLQQLASLAQDGLYFFCPDEKWTLPIIEKEEFIEKGIFYLPTTKWKSAPYISPTGEIFEEVKVYFIKNPS